jgi:hypothetical protein
VTDAVRGSPAGSREDRELPADSLGIVAAIGWASSRCSPPTGGGTADHRPDGGRVRSPAGATPAEAEAEVTTGLERRLWGIPGVEYVLDERP